MIFSSIFIGFFATIVGALPPGASNMAVIKTTIKDSTRESLKISYGAGVGEITLALTALFFGIAVKDFFNEHIWVQYLAASILLILGTYLVIKKSSEDQNKVIIKKRKRSKYMLGFTLGLVNPPVLIYWVLILSMLHSFIGSTENISLIWLVLFLTGVFSGKVLTLYGYSKLGCHLHNKKETNSDSLNRYLGIALALVGLFQFLKLLFF